MDVHPVESGAAVLIAEMAGVSIVMRVQVLNMLLEQSDLFNMPNGFSSCFFTTPAETFILSPFWFPLRKINTLILQLMTKFNIFKEKFRRLRGVKGKN